MAAPFAAASRAALPFGATLIAAALLVAVTAAPAAAQTIDYGSLRELFGEPVTTSATGAPQRASQVPATMDIITQEDIQRSPAVDLPGILRHYTGIDVSQWTNGAADVSVRGYNQPFSPRLLVLINGRQVYLDHFGMTVWNTLPIQLAEIQQIEVVRGPNSALFGFNAVAGVINIITYNPLYDDVNSAQIRVGTQNHREASAVVSQKLSERLGVRLSAGGYNADEFTTTLDTPLQAADRVNPRRRAANADLLAQLAPGVQFGLEGSFSDVRQAEFLPQYEMAQSDYRTYSLKAALTAETDIGLIEASLYTNWLDTQYNSASFPFVDIKQRVTVARIQDLFKLGTDHTLRLTGEYRFNTFDHSTQDIYGRLKAPTVSYDVLSLGGMWNWQATPELALTSALRLDHLRLEREGTAVVPAGVAQPLFSDAQYDRDITEWSLNLGAVWEVSAVDTLRATVARGVQVPTLVEFGYLEPRAIVPPSRLPVSYFQGSPLLEPTIVWNYELGYDRKLPPLDATARVGVFYQTSQDIKSLPTSLPNFRTLTTSDQIFRNVGDSRMVGVEAGLKGLFGSEGEGRWGVNYTFMSIEDDIDNTGSFGGRTVFDTPIDFENSTPAHKINVHAGYTFGRVEADLFGYYVSGVDMLRYTNAQVPNTYQREGVGSYVGLDARLGVRIADGITAAVHGIGINRTDITETSGPAVERRFFLTLTGKF